MLDIKAIRENPDAFKKDLARKGVPASAIEKLLDTDKKRREKIQKIESIAAQQNEVSKKIPQLKGDEKQKILSEMKSLSAEKKKLEGELEVLEMNYEQIFCSTPNPPHPSAPDGKDEEDNVVIRTEGTKPEFDFKTLEHWEIGEKLGILDTERSAKVSGSRFYYLREELATLQRALIFWAFREITKRGYSPTIPPFLTREKAIFGTGYLAKDENYIVNPGEDDLYLIGTSEVPMVSYYADEILEEDHMPARFVSYSPCFRREAGSYGKDTKGIFRVHQFEKVEMVVFCLPEDSEALHEEIREIEEDLLRQLEIPYQVINVCCGDLGVSAAKKYDLEAWLPGQGKYREMTSTSICTDFQSRRLNIRIRRKNGDIVYAHVLNGTAVSSRPLIGILENFQQKDGSVKIPKALQPFCGFEKIEAQ
ncbi:serine--tRNA ligase [Candidatus Gracilibacteria bacterium]|nr:serine--tRNA ligase [Candidatus Gracilibacteria bacterium]MCF7819545.1 serine--tRNA ligase [Candidatus Gracilibacteria bacterium]